jgi:hypothetical protein
LVETNHEAAMRERKITEDQREREREIERERHD